MRRLTEYTVRAALRASCRRAASPTTTPSPVHATIEGRSARPSASGITLGTPWSTQATRLLVVPRSMPTMRNMAVVTLSERVAQVVDHGLQICPRRQRLLELLERRPAVAARVDEPVPLRKAPEQRGLPGRLPLEEPPPLFGEPYAGSLVEPGGLGLFEGFLDLEHLLEQVHGRLGLGRAAFHGFPPLLESDQVLDSRQWVAERAVCPVDQRGGFQRRRLGGLGRRLVEVRMVLPR